MLNNKINISNNINVNTSFKGKPSFPYRLNSPYQDDFHATSSQIYIRDYLEMVEQGMDDIAIINNMFPTTSNLPESKLEPYKEFIDKLKEQIKKTDESFKKIIPMMFPKTYYRGVCSSKDNRCIKTVSNAQKGDIIKPDLGYPFATSKKSYAIDYATDTQGGKSPEKSILMEIKTPAGVRLARHIAYSSKNPFAEQNVVFPRGVSYEVLDKQEKDGFTYIKLKYLDADGLK